MRLIPPESPPESVDEPPGKVDPQFYDRLLQTPEHQQRVERIARKHTWGTAIAWEDAAQTAHIKVMQAVRAGKFRWGGGAEFYRWAATVSRFEIIDLLRREQSRLSTSLDAPLPGTDLLLSDTIAAEFDALDVLERADLVQRTIAAIADLDQRYPDRGYLKLWQGQVEGQKQTQLAERLGISQGEVSKRWRELLGRLTVALGLVPPETVAAELQSAQQRQGQRRRSPQSW